MWEKNMWSFDVLFLKKDIEQFLCWNKNWVVVIWWATATGKTWLSMQLADHFPIEIISADSRQVYRGMDIGTDKVSQTDQAHVPHRWLDLVDPDEEFTAGQWKTYTEQKIEEIQARGHIPVVVGGTWLYIDMLYRNFSMPELAPQRQRRENMMTKEQNTLGRLYEELLRVDPEEAKKHHVHSHRYLIRALEIWTFTWKTKTERSGEQPVRRPLLMLWLRREKEQTNQLIDERIDELFTRWLVNEVEWLLAAWYTPEMQSMQSIWYKEIVGCLQWAYDLEEAKTLLKHNTHRLAKRQRTWFRKYIQEAEQKPKEQVVYRVMFL